MQKTLIPFALGCLTLLPVQAAVQTPAEEIAGTSGDRFISGVYPHLTTYGQSRKSGVFSRKDSDECGIGAVIPWAGKLWMITYASHCPRGSEHKLYYIDEKLNMTIHPESVGGTPAARMIHCESNHLLLGHYQAPHEEGELQPDQGDSRQEGVAHRVAQDHRPLEHALGARGSDKVLS